MPEKDPDKEAVEKIRKVVREELDKTEWELPTHTHDKPGEKEIKEEVKVEEEKCEDCGTTVSKDSKFCRSCGGELDWPES